MARMYDYSLPGKTEQENWAELHYENIRSGGEWLETRLLAVGQRTNPWFQECSDYIAQTGDMLAFDTDMIGPYGYCADLSRSWTIGHTRMTGEQSTLYSNALAQIEHNTALIRPGMDFREYMEKTWPIPNVISPPLFLRAAWCRHGRRIPRRALRARRRLPDAGPLRAGNGLLRGKPNRRAGRARKRQAGNTGSCHRNRFRAA